MKTKLASLLFITALSISVTGCKDKAKEAETTKAVNVEETTNTISYTLDRASSVIRWKGFKPTGAHNGVLAFENGTLEVNDGDIVGGSFNIEMGTITVLDIPGSDEGNAKLTGHLKGADFFDVEQYPTASFTITGLETKKDKIMLSGNLKLKGIENNVTFPVMLSEEGNSLTLTSEVFTIDRTKWNVQYGSKSIFKNLGDKFINDDMELKIYVRAIKS